jgi:hypothetical protein
MPEWRRRTSTGRLSSTEAGRFYREVEAVVRDHADEAGDLTMHTAASLVWGRPLPQADERR